MTSSPQSPEAWSPPKTPHEDGSTYAGIVKPYFTHKEEKNRKVVIIQKEDLIQIFGRIQ
jgi:hypothetical protein